jgi:adenylosuccinate synthase
MAAAAAVASQGLVAAPHQAKASPSRKLTCIATPSFCGKTVLWVRGGTAHGAAVGNGGVRCEAQAIEREVVKADRERSRQEDPFSGLKQVCAVLGTQWGDEGKGKLVDILAQRFDVVARCQVWWKISPQNHLFHVSEITLPSQ